MYNTRASQKAAMFADENKKVEAPKAGVVKATRSNVSGATGVTAGNRRALADVGNLATATAKVTTKGETQERAFGTNLSNADIKKAAAQVTEKWAAGKCQQRTIVTRSQKELATTQGAVAAPQPAHSMVGSTMSGASTKSKSTITRGPRTKKDPQSLTAALTSTAEEVIGDMELDMGELEDALPDIDSVDKDDPLAVTEYVADIYQFYKKAEAESVVSPDYMLSQSDINDKMRGILLDWLVEVHLKFKLMPETLYLTTNLIDRFLAVSSVSRKNLQLVGVTAMLLASKYEEIWAPEVKDFVYISDNAYTKDQILAMEKLMLNTLKFNLTVPTPFVFTARFLKAAQADKDVQTVAWFLVELCLPEYSMLRYSPSHLAAAAVFTAQRTLGKSSAWGNTLMKHSGYSEQQLRLCVSQMIALHQKAGTGNLTAVHKKYSTQKFLSVAQLPPAVLPMDDEASQC